MPTVRISKQLKSILYRMKLVDGETYENVILGLIEDRMQFNSEFKQKLEKSNQEYKGGRFIPLAKIRKNIHGRV